MVKAPVPLCPAGVFSRLAVKGWDVRAATAHVAALFRLSSFPASSVKLTPTLTVLPRSSVPIV